MNKYQRMVTLKRDILDKLDVHNTFFENNFKEGHATPEFYCGSHPAFTKEGLVYSVGANELVYWGYFRKYRGLKAVQKFFGVSRRTAFYLMLKGGECGNWKTDKDYLISTARAAAENYIMENKR